jgi:hypothetical protein
MTRKPSEATKEATRKAEEWFDCEALMTEPQQLKWKPPRAAVLVGQIVAIEYLSDKFDGKERVYRHEFDELRLMAISPDGATIVVDPPMKITRRGIEG